MVQVVQEHLRLVQKGVVPRVLQQHNRTALDLRPRHASGCMLRCAPLLTAGADKMLARLGDIVIDLYTAQPVCGMHH